MREWEIKNMILSNVIQLSFFNNNVMLLSCSLFFFVCIFLGQIELYTHVPVMRRLADQLQQWNFRTCAVFLIDSQFCVEQSKFLSGMLTALSSMIQLEIPFINFLTKVDLLTKKEKKKLQKYVV